MNPILQALNGRMLNNRQTDPKAQVMAIIDNMSPAQRANFNKMLPVIERIAQAKGVDTSALTELQSRM